MHVRNYSEGKKESSLYTSKLKWMISGTDKCYKAKLFNMGATQKFMNTNENETLGSCVILGTVKMLNIHT